MDNINKMFTVTCVLITCFVVGGLADHCLGGGAVCDRPSGGLGSLGSILPKDTFNNMLKHRNDGACLARGFYTYEAFIQAAKSFPAFASTGNADTQKREVAAFLGQTSHETTGGWPTAPDGPYAWGYCFKQEKSPPSNYCRPSNQYPCAPGKSYYGRGPIQLTGNR